MTGPVASAADPEKRFFFGALGGNGPDGDCVNRDIQGYNDRNWAMTHQRFAQRYDAFRYAARQPIKVSIYT